MSFNQGIKKYEIGRGCRSLQIEVFPDNNKKYLVRVTYTKPSTTIYGDRSYISVGWMLKGVFYDPFTARLTGHRALYFELMERGLFAEFKELLKDLELIISYKNIFE